MSDDIEEFFTDEIDARLEKLHGARLRGDDVARGWYKLVLAALVALRRVRRADPGK